MNRKKVNDLLGELEEYAEEIRGDWSCFDGRDLLAFVRDWIGKMDKALGGKGD